MEAKKKRKAKQGVYTVLMLVCIVVFLFALYNVVTIMMDYKEIDNYYDDTVKEFVEVEDDILAGVDFARIRGVNEDVVAWIDIKDTNISYPVLQGKDNNYYLNRNYEKQYLVAGSIFVDADNNGNFKDLHTIIYGHNMHNGAMFGSLDKFQKEEYRDEHPYVELLMADGKRYKYEIYSYYTADIDDGTFEVFAGGQKAYNDYVALTTKKNVYTNTEAPKKGEKIITLSTCTEDSDDYKRNVLHAKYVGVVK